MDFSEKLRNARISAGYKTQTAMARTLGIERLRYAAWEAGRAEPPMEMIARICNLTGVSADYLLGLSDRADLHTMAPPQKFKAPDTESIIKQGTDQLTPEEVREIREMLLQSKR